MNGAGGTKGGIGRFFIGLIMMIAGGYLFLNSIRVSNGFHFGYSFMSIGGFNLTGGMVLVPFIFGVGMIFYNGKSITGWLLSISSIIMLAFGIITNIHFRLRSMSAFELMTIIVLAVGGIGLFLSSLKSLGEDESNQ